MSPSMTLPEIQAATLRVVEQLEGLLWEMRWRLRDDGGGSFHLRDAVGHCLAACLVVQLGMGTSIACAVNQLKDK